MPVYKRALSTWVGGKQQDDAEEQEDGHRGWTICYRRHPPPGCSQVHQGPRSAHFSQDSTHRQLSFADAARLTSAAVPALTALTALGSRRHAIHNMSTNKVVYIEMLFYIVHINILTYIVHIVHIN